jgi:hypothetical protein
VRLGRCAINSSGVVVRFDPKDGRDRIPEDSAVVARSRLICVYSADRGRYYVSVFRLAT